MGKILLVACTNVGRYIIEEMMTNPNIGAQLVGVVNLNTQQAINKANYDAYSDLVEKYDLPIYYCNSVNDDETIAFMQRCRPDVILQSGWSQKFSERVLKLAPYGCIGEHPAPLPRGRGAACVNWAILTGERDWGDSYFQMVSQYDKGKLYAQQFFTIEPYDTVFTVYEKVAACAVKTIRENAANWSNGIFREVEQDESKVTYYKRRRPSDGEITDFAQDAMILHNFIRAQTHPYPGAFVTTAQGKVYLLASDVCGEQNGHAAGTVFAKTERGSILVSAGAATTLEIVRVKPENAPSMWAADWVAGRALPFHIFEY